MISKSRDRSDFTGLIKFLIRRKQYPFSGKRQLLNRGISIYSFFHIKAHKEPCDALFILPSPELGFRYNHIVDALSKIGLQCKMVFFSDRDIIKLSLKGALYATEQLSQDFAIEKGFALYIKYKYAPKIIFQATDASYISTFLKFFSGASLINIAHCVSCMSGHFDVFNYHYYFIFGNSSIINLEKISHSYGNTELVKTGSLFLKPPYSKTISDTTTPNGFERHILFSSQWLSLGICEDIQWSREIINSLAERNPTWKFTIKFHPLEYDRDWINPLPNVFIVTSDNDYRELLSDVSFHITHHSAFALEASVCNVPTICLQRKSFKEDCLSLKKYFPVVDEIPALEKIIQGQEPVLWDIAGFIMLHLSNVGSEMETFTATVNQILKGEAIASYSLIGTYAD